MTLINFARLLFVLALSLCGVGFLWAQSVQAADRECVVACLDVQHECLSVAGEAARACKADAGCDLLRDAAREVCRAETPDPEACQAARETLRACVASCRDEVKAQLRLCDDDAGACLNEECNVELFCPRRGPKPGAQGGPDGQGGPGGPAGPGGPGGPGGEGGEGGPDGPPL